MDKASVRAVDELVHLHERLGAVDVPVREGVECRLDHLLRADAHVFERLGEHRVRGRVLDELRQFGDGDAVVGHTLEVEVDVQDREHVS